MDTINVDLTLQKPSFKMATKLQIPNYGVTALFGRSGSGKTTLLRCIAGLEKAEGTLQIGDQVWQGPAAFLPPHKREVGYVFQNSNLFPHLNVEGNLRFGLRRALSRNDALRFDQVVDMLGLSDLLQRSTMALSGGQQQRVGIARALLSKPRILLMDEPLASLDIKSKEEILPYLDDLHETLKIPVIYVSHSPNEVVRIADYMALMEGGSVIASGPLNEILTQTNLPIAEMQDACAVVNGVVTDHDEKYHLTYLKVGAGTIALPRDQVPVGKPVRVRILAKDVSLALSPPSYSSITNILPAKIVQLAQLNEPSSVIVKLDLGDESILSKVTARSVDLLNLAEEQTVYAQIKSVALV